MSFEICCWDNMIRDFKESDIEEVLDIWLTASIKAHYFINKGFWESKIDDMRYIYIPSSETYVYERDNQVLGFISLYEDTITALFVDPAEQGKGIGTELMNKCKTLRKNLNLTVFKNNIYSFIFYKKCGFNSIKEQPDEHSGHQEILMKFVG